MKIYNKLVLSMSDWSVVLEDSFMYSGPMALCEGEEGAEGAEGEVAAEITLMDTLPEDMRGDKLPGSLKDFASVKIPGKDADEKDVKEFHSKIGSVLKAYSDTKSMTGGMIKMPGKDAKPEEIAAFRAKLGVPAKPEEYKIEKPEFEKGKAMFSDELFAGFTKLAHETGMTPAQVQAAVNFQAEMVKAQINEMDKAAADGVAVLQQELGDDYDSLMQGAELTVAKYFSDEAKEKIKQFGIGNDPDFVRGLIAIHKATKEDGDLKGLKQGGDRNETVEAIKSEIDTLMASKEYANGDQATHDKVAKLFVDKQKALGTFKADVRSSKVEV